MIAGNILQEAKINNINPNRIRDEHFYELINKIERAEKDLKNEREIKNKNLESNSAPRSKLRGIHLLYFPTFSPIAFSL